MKTVRRPTLASSHSIVGGLALGLSGLAVAGLHGCIRETGSATQRVVRRLSADRDAPSNQNRSTASRSSIAKPGPQDAPVVLLLHGFPTSSHMFRNLIPALADRYHVIAPDYPGYGQSDMPTARTFKYTFDRFGELVDGLLDQLGVKRYAMYVMDYGAPVGWRLALKHPERVSGADRAERQRLRRGAEGVLGSDQAYWADGLRGPAARRSDVAGHAGNHEVPVHRRRVAT